jgi:GT2 family glycosyltransferase
LPRVSVILPIYQSQRTLARSLESLGRQSYRDYDVIAVDSSPNDACSAIVERFEGAILVRSEERLPPHEACNLGIDRASGELLAFTDPDAYPRPDWLERLVMAGSPGSRVCVGAVACFGRRWLDQGAHLCKFDKWLPMGSPRQLSEGPTVNLLIPRDLFQGAGGRFQHGLHGDTELCWRLRQLGIEIWSAPEAIVEHHHLHSWRSLLAERFERGAGYANLRLTWERARVAALLVRLAASVLPLRLVTQLWRVGCNARRAGMTRIYLLTLPIVAIGLYSGLLGESCAVARQAVRRMRVSNP